MRPADRGIYCACYFPLYSKIFSLFLPLFPLLFHIMFLFPLFPLFIYIGNFLPFLFLTYLLAFKSYNTYPFYNSFSRCFPSSNPLHISLSEKWWNPWGTDRDEDPDLTCNNLFIHVIKNQFSVPHPWTHINIKVYYSLFIPFNLLLIT